MNTRQRQAAWGWMAAGSFVLLSGCAGVSPPLVPDFVDPGFAPAAVDRITVLPVADLRVDRSIDLDSETINEAMSTDFVGTADIASLLKRKGYVIAPYAKGYGRVNSIKPDDLEDVKPDWIAQLGQDNSPWLLLLTLDDFVSRSTFGAALSAKCSGYLFDKNAGKLVWRHSSTNEIGLGGLVALAIKGLVKNDVLTACTTSLVERLPPKP